MSTKRVHNPRKVYVAMSGGVDSSVAAALLVKQGYDVTGVFFKPWSDTEGLSYCNWQEDRHEAMRVAVTLGIRFETWDFSKEYGELVTQYMIDSYRAGITPNPDVMCNKEIKFGIFLQKALTAGADYIATGHYARLKKATRDKRQETRLLKAKDTNKDQTYFLYTLTQEQLRYCLFPIGEYLKPKVRTLAKKIGLLNYAKKDSQGVCFVGKLDMKDFLEKYIEPKPGEIRLVGTDRTIGTHDGVSYYTIGQRHGLDIGLAGGPYFVAAKDIEKNIIYVDTVPPVTNTKSNTIHVHDITWTRQLTKLPSTISAKVRYRSREIPAILTHAPDGQIIVTFKKSAHAVTPGQAAVFYKGQEMLGGGIIE